MTPPDTARDDRPRWLARRAAHQMLCGILRLRSQPWRDVGRGSALIIAPHPDDETFGCGGLIAAKRQAGTDVQVLFVTDGSGSHPQHPSLSPAAVGALRRSEASAATHQLGLTAGALTFLDGPDGQLSRLPEDRATELVDRITEKITAMAPAEILLPSRRDGSSEHHGAHSLALQAVRKSGSSVRLLEYPVWSWWSPRLLLRLAIRSRRVWRLSISAQVAAKRSALACYRSQTEPTPPWAAPVLPAGFTALFASPVEYFFEE